MILYFLWGLAAAAPLSPDEAVAAALASHPAIARAEADQTAAEGAARQSALLSQNPEIQAGYGLIGERVEGSVTQPISLTGEGLAQRRNATAQIEAAGAAADRARLTVAAEVRRAYIEAVVAHQRAELSQAAFDLSSRQLTAAEARVRAGEAADLDLRLARLDQAKTARDLLDARAAEASALSTLAALTHRALTGDDLAADPALAAPPPAVRPTNPADPGARSDVRAAQGTLDAAVSSLNQARAASLPPITLGGFYEAGTDETIAGISLGATLPVWHQNQADIGAAQGAVGIARAELDAARSAAEADLQAAAEAATRAEDTLSRVPATDADATAALASIEAGARSGELDLLTTILLRSEVIAGQQALAEARGDLALARINLLLATEDEALLSGGAQ